MPTFVLMPKVSPGLNINVIFLISVPLKPEPNIRFPFTHFPSLRAPFLSSRPPCWPLLRLSVFPRPPAASLCHQRPPLCSVPAASVQGPDHVVASEKWGQARPREWWWGCCCRPWSAQSSRSSCCSSPPCWLPASPRTPGWWQPLPLASWTCGPYRAQGAPAQGLRWARSAPVVPQEGASVRRGAEGDVFSVACIPTVMTVSLYFSKHVPHIGKYWGWVGERCVVVI